MRFLQFLQDFTLKLPIKLGNIVFLPPSSPSMALFKEGKLVHFIERHHIEGQPAEVIAENLTEAFKEYC